MKTVFTTFMMFFFATTTVPAQAISIEMLRKEYFSIIKNETRCKTSYHVLKAKTNQSPLHEAYFGAITMAMAQYTINVLDKWKYFNTGKQILENVIQKYPNVAEMRFLRITVQDNVPALLSYSSNINEDKDLVLSQYDKITDINLRKNIRDYFIKSNFCTNAEKEKLSD